MDFLQSSLFWRLGFAALFGLFPSRGCFMLLCLSCNQNALWPCFIFSHYYCYCYCFSRLVPTFFSALFAYKNVRRRRIFPWHEEAQKFTPSPRSVPLRVGAISGARGGKTIVRAGWAAEDMHGWTTKDELELGGDEMETLEGQMRSPRIGQG